MAVSIYGLGDKIEIRRNTVNEAIIEIVSPLIAGLILKKFIMIFIAKPVNIDMLAANAVACFQFESYCNNWNKKQH